MTFRIAFLILGVIASTPVAAAATSPAKPEPNCVDVQIGTDRAAALECLNQAFQKSVAREHGAPPEIPVDARSSPVAAGLANETAARQRMGNAFGVSSVAQRPVRVYTPSLPVPPPR